LKFISGLSDDVAQKIILCLRENLESSAAFSIKLAEFKTFDRLGKPSVLWMSVLDPGKKFLSLAETVEKITTPLGIAPNREHYIPHLTVARFPASESNRLKCLLAILAAPNKEFVPMELQVRSVALMRRFQGKGQRADGPLYQSLGGIDLIT
jgi:2'-5' RNA ligase